MDNINHILSKELGISLKQVTSVIEMLDEGNTVPFIARYRKERTGGLTDEVLRKFNERLTYLRNLESRKEDVLRISGELKIIGLSPNNDTHIFEIVNNNGNLKEVIYYYYDETECEVIKSLLSNFTVEFLPVKNLWQEYR